MAQQPTKQGSHPPTIAAAVDPDHLRGPVRSPILPIPNSLRFFSLVRIPHLLRVAAPARHSSPTGGTDCPKLSAAAGLGLPDDPIAEIISRLPAKALFRFKCVSQAWFRLITDWFRKSPQTLHGFFYGKNGGRNYGHFFDLLGGSVPPVDPSFASPPQLPETQKFILLHSCNGLVFFHHKQYSLNTVRSQTLGYIVCNPATKEWVTVPISDWSLDKGQWDYDLEEWSAFTYLIFDPAVSSQFKLVQLCFDSLLNTFQVYTYLSESGVWSERASKCWSDETLQYWLGSAFVNGMLHLIIGCSYPEHTSAIVAVDGEGEKCRIIHWAEQEHGLLVFLGQSQGNLVCVSEHIVDRQPSIAELSIWVLEDYGTEQWILKGRMSSLLLFGKANPSRCFTSSTIAIHPDRNVVFFFHRLNGKLVSYDMDSKEVSTLITLEHFWTNFISYSPYFAASSALAKKQ